MSFDDRLRDELRKATESHPIDAEHALRGVRSTQAGPPLAPVSDEPIAVPLVEADLPRRRQVRTQRLVGVAAAIVLVAGAVALPLALRDHPTNSARKTTQKLPTKKNGPVDRAALKAVASALNATTGAGSFRVAYSLVENPSTTPTTTSCQSLLPRPYVPGPTGTMCLSSSPNNVTTVGVATVNVNPFAMVATSNVSNFGPVTVRVDDTNYWETTGSNSETVPTTAGQPISGFASLVESTLGPREGAQAMMGLASPTGYLSITREAITGATKIGESTLDGTPVTNYRVVVDLARLATVPGLSPEELTTINAALGVMQREGFTGNTTDVSVDDHGYVVHTRSVNNFADGGSVTSDDTFSLFGCAGAVQLPGRPVSIPSCTSLNAATTTTAPAPSSGSSTTLPSAPLIGQAPPTTGP